MKRDVCWSWLINPMVCSGRRGSGGALRRDGAVSGTSGPEPARVSRLAAADASRLRRELDGLLQRLRELAATLPVPAKVAETVTAFFGPDTRLAVRSSANGEDLEKLASAGLYDSVINVRAAEASKAIAQVWSSLWTRRATLSRTRAGIPHSQIHMAVLLQEMVTPDLSFILRTRSIR